MSAPACNLVAVWVQEVRRMLAVPDFFQRVAQALELLLPLSDLVQGMEVDRSVPSAGPGGGPGP